MHPKSLIRCDINFIIFITPCKQHTYHFSITLCISTNIWDIKVHTQFQFDSNIFASDVCNADTFLCSNWQWRSNFTLSAQCCTCELKYYWWFIVFFNFMTVVIFLYLAQHHSCILSQVRKVIAIFSPPDYREPETCFHRASSQWASIWAPLALCVVSGSDCSETPATLLTTKLSEWMSRCCLQWVMCHEAASESEMMGWLTCWTDDEDLYEDSAWDLALCQPPSKMTTLVRSSEKWQTSATKMA